MAPEFTYLPYLIPMLLAEVILLVLISWSPFFCKRGSPFAATARGHLIHKPLLSISFLNQEDVHIITDGGDEAALQLLPPIPFHSTFSSVNDTFTRILLLTRFVSCIFFLGIGIVWNTIDNDDDMFDLKYFTNWNILLVSLYFILALITSTLGASSKSENAVEHRYLSQFLFITFEVVGSTAFLITVVNFSLLDSNIGHFFNTVCHFATSASLLLEMLLNRMRVRLAHYPFMLLWFLSYLCVIWPCVVTGRVTNWPYDFLATDTPACFLWYSGLLLLTTIFFGAWFALSKLKNALHSVIEKREKLMVQNTHEERAIAFLNDSLLIPKNTELA